VAFLYSLLLEFARTILPTLSSNLCTRNVYWCCQTSYVIDSFFRA